MNNRIGGWLLLTFTLCIGAVWLAQSKTIQRTPPVFTPVVEQVQMKRVRSTSNVPGENAYHIVILIGYQGSKPAWWGQQDGTIFNKTIINLRGKNGPQFLVPCFISRAGRKSAWNQMGQLPSLFDPVRQQYYVDLEVGVSGSFPILDCSIAGIIKMGDGSTANVFASVPQALRYSPSPSVLCP